MRIVVAPSCWSRHFASVHLSEDVMAFYRKNIGGLHQTLRIAAGLAVVIAAFV